MPAEIKNKMLPEVKKRARRKAERPAEILDAAFEEFVKSGYAATRLEDVAARAGVTKGTIYFYFDTKERVFEEMVRRTSQALFPEIESYAASLEGSYASRLRALIAFLLSRIAENRGLREMLRFLIAEGARFPGLVDRHDAEFVQPMIEQIHKLIEAGTAAGEFRPARSVIRTDLIMSPAIFLIVWTLLFGDRKKIDLAEFTDVSFDLILNGLRAD
jgi:AcrR family transcriptional regulator